MRKSTVINSSSARSTAFELKVRIFFLESVGNFINRFYVSVPELLRIFKVFGTCLGVSSVHIPFDIADIVFGEHIIHHLEHIFLYLGG